MQSRDEMKDRYVLLDDVDDHGDNQVGYGEPNPNQLEFDFDDQ